VFFGVVPRFTDRRVFELEVKGGESFKDEFKNCIFKVLPQHEYVAKKAFEKHTKLTAVEVGSASSRFRFHEFPLDLRRLYRMFGRMYACK
jgi:hypothetical protein